MKQLILFMAAIVSWAGASSAWAETEAETHRRLMGMGYSEDEVSLRGILRRMHEGADYEAADFSPYGMLEHWPVSDALTQKVVTFALAEARASSSLVRFDMLLSILETPMVVARPFGHFGSESVKGVRELYDLLSEKPGQEPARVHALRILNHFSSTAAFASRELWAVGGSGMDPDLRVDATFALLNAPGYSTRAFTRLQGLLGAKATQKWVLASAFTHLPSLPADPLDFFRGLTPRDVHRDNRKLLKELHRLIGTMDATRNERIDAAGGGCLVPFTPLP